MLSLHFYVCYCVLISLFLGRGVVSQSCLITIIIHSFIPSFNKTILNINYVPGTILGVGNTAMNMTDVEPIVCLGKWINK